MVVLIDIAVVLVNTESKANTSPVANLFPLAMSLKRVQSSRVPSVYKGWELLSPWSC